jgi:predicted ATP-dependent endonuclease of OLD family
MLKKLILRNFQAHKKLELEFDPHVTTIVGPTDKGKTSALRGIGFICLNKPAGDAYTRFGAKHATGILEFDESVLVRRKGKKVNTYKLDGKQYKSFGAGKVPDAVAEALNISAINFQRQMDAPFWFTESAGQVSKNLNEIVNLSVIDTTLANIASEVRQAKAVMMVSKERYQQFKDKVEELKWVPVLLKQWEILRKLQKQAESRAAKGASLRSLLQTVAKHTRAQGRAKIALQSGKDAVQAGRQALVKREHTVTLRNHIRKLQEAENLAKQELPDISPLLVERKRADGIAEKRRRLMMMVDNLQTVETETCLLRRKLKDSQTELNRLAKNRRCSKCGQRISTTHSPSPSGTCTSHTSPPSGGAKNQIGIRLRQDT